MPKQVVMPSKKSNIIYENWKVKKAQWYLKKNLAVLLPESRAIQLTFEAKGDGHQQGDYMVQDRSNTCVACGGNTYLTMHHVVPEMYRHWMPLAVKSKSYCHDQYEQKATAFKKQGVARFGISLEGRGWITLPHYKKAKKAASALLRSSDKIPLDRQTVLKDIVVQFWQEEHPDDTTTDFDCLLRECSELQDHFKGPDFIEHGQEAIRQLTQQCIIKDNKETWPDLENFIKEWRQHFLDHVQPKHLSPLWTVDASIYTHS
ncbi:uncharacterized protein B0P05DRAFT_581702 [Gilbertella persicaria]|uniref:uncharacterized protein n=1 Tax=Gilbertella persicaria TaxID=101096 RepID=UPI002220C61D|nr:uncharacterized protein B0P05DRAFT_581702 [Gilbertella persicaria]KAI8055553.1 hypothetical protein B0P05DRAFT_581702 [Gilbertella persicaria]